MASRKIRWLSSTDPHNTKLISDLENRLVKFYMSSPDYYHDIDFTSENWTNEQELPYMDILATAKISNRILEVGCGSANILKYNSGLQEKYTGCDFSRELLKIDKQKYPGSNFIALKQANILPFGDNQFDLVFTVFVLEHSTSPSLFLNECIRVLKPKGIFIILCPDFMGNGKMDSQRAGFGPGTTMDKIKQKKYIDALVTFFDNRIKIPGYCKYLSYKLRKAPQFYINVEPTVFCDAFMPDVDAIYVTSRSEIITYLKNTSTLIDTSSFHKYEKKNKFMYLKFRKINMSEYYPFSIIQ